MHQNCVNALLQASAFPPAETTTSPVAEATSVNALLQASAFPQGEKEYDKVQKVLMLFYKLLLFHSTLSKTLYLCGFASLFLQVFV